MDEQRRSLCLSEEPTWYKHRRVSSRCSASNESVSNKQISNNKPQGKLTVQVLNDLGLNKDKLTRVGFEPTNSGVIVQICLVEKTCLEADKVLGHVPFKFVHIPPRNSATNSASAVLMKNSTKMQVRCWNYVVNHFCKLE